MDAVIFDMDGVLVDSEPAHGLALSAALEEIGVGFEMGLQVGWSDRDAIIASLEGAGRAADAALVDRLLGRKHERMVEMIEGGKIEAYAGAADLVRELAQDVPVAVCSAGLGSEVRMLIAQLGIEGALRTVVTADDVARGKPDPQPYLLTGERLGVDARRCVAVEDSERGVASARAAGCVVIAVGHTSPAQALREAHCFVRCIGDLTKGRLAKLVGDVNMENRARRPSH